MTDLEKFIALYKELGIDLAPEPCDPMSFGMMDNCKFTLTIDASHPSGKMFSDYDNIGTTIFFDAGGRFLKQFSD